MDIGTTVGDFEEMRRIEAMESTEPVHYGRLASILEIRKQTARDMRKKYPDGESRKLCLQLIEYCDAQLKYILALK